MFRYLYQGARRWLAPVAIGLIGVNSVPANESGVDDEPLWVQVIGRSDEPWGAVSRSKQRALEQSLADKFAALVPGDVSVRYCGVGSAEGCAQSLAEQARLVIALDALTEAMAATGLSFRFGAGDPRSGDVGAEVVLPISCTLQDGDIPARQVRQSVDPARLQADALAVDYLAKRLFQACAGLLAGEFNSATERSYTAYPGVFLERQRRDSVALTGAAETGGARQNATTTDKETVYIFRNASSEVIFQLGNNGLNR